MFKKKISRAYFKIKEIDKRTNIFKKERTILELGSYPGGWTQYILEEYKNIFLVSVDRKEVFFKKKNFVFIKGNIFDDETIKKISKIKKKFDLIISDVCDNISGVNIIDKGNFNLIIKRISLIGKIFLKKKKNLLFKNLIEGLEKDIRINFNYFDKVNIFRLKFRKKKSSESFIFCINKK
ncbi:Ribosomal RNA large subunit methyltransferase E [Candidatus Vidania fulgoroideae]|nr:Ribosomal RNA large subunit methyltransferase E [Candidatus Vidania fulgoroideae]